MFKTSRTESPPATTLPLTANRPRLDRMVLLILTVGLVLRFILALGLHHHFRHAEPAHLWPGTDEVVYYQYGVLSAKALRVEGWSAFIDSIPSTRCYNWLHYKYTGLVLFLASDSPLALRLLSIGFTVAAILIFLAAFRGGLAERSSQLFFVAVLTLLPSAAFWSVLAVKEGLVLFLTASLCWGVARLWERSRPWPALGWTASCCFVLGCIRIWAGLGFFCVALFILLLGHPGRPRPPFNMLLILVCLASLWLLPNVRMLIEQYFLYKNPNSADIITGPQFDFIERAGQLEDQHVPILLKPLFAHVSILLKPLLAWILPLPLISSGGTLITFAGFENLIFLTLMAMGVYYGASRRLTPTEILWLGWFFVLLTTTVVIGSNLGTIYRNKGTTLPFLAYFAARAFPPLLKRLRVCMKMG